MSCRILYLNFKEALVDLIDDDLINRFKTAGAFYARPAHFSLLVRNYLNNHFRNRWLGRGSQLPWPARSTDINSLDFPAWGFHFCFLFNFQAL